MTLELDLRDEVACGRVGDLDQDQHSVGAIAAQAVWRRGWTSEDHYRRD